MTTKRKSRKRDRLMLESTFYDLTVEWLESLPGCIKNATDAMYAYSIPTIYGQLDLTLHIPTPSASTDSYGILYSVFSRFQDPRFVAGRLSINPHSGKWNLHYSPAYDGECTPETAFAQFKRDLSRVLIPVDAKRLLEIASDLVDTFNCIADPSSMSSELTDKINAMAKIVEKQPK